MKKEKKLFIVLLAGYDDDDALLAEKVLNEYQLASKIYRVRDGEGLMDFLLNRGDYTDPDVAPQPTLVLLDLNMPDKDGLEALKEIKGNPELRKIPVAILTMSPTDEDISRAYDLGVNSFIKKPLELKEFMEVVRGIGDYWLETVHLPK
ncbi:MAG: response regulator [Candidatus Omnitrophica bacterium]|nr:response regulator [Candidatus Omnitrophota bacterium]